MSIVKLGIARGKRIHSEDRANIEELIPLAFNDVGFFLPLRSRKEAKNQLLQIVVTPLAYVAFELFETYHVISTFLSGINSSGKLNWQEAGELMVASVTLAALMVSIAAEALCLSFLLPLQLATRTLATIGKAIATGVGSGLNTGAELDSKFAVGSTCPNYSAI